MEDEKLNTDQLNTDDDLVEEWIIMIRNNYTIDMLKYYPVTIAYKLNLEYVGF